MQLFSIRVPYLDFIYGGKHSLWEKYVFFKMGKAESSEASWCAYWHSERRKVYSGFIYVTFCIICLLSLNCSSRKVEEDDFEDFTPNQKWIMSPKTHDTDVTLLLNQLLREYDKKLRPDIGSELFSVWFFAMETNVFYYIIDSCTNVSFSDWYAWSIFHLTLVFGPG